MAFRKIRKFYTTRLNLFFLVYASIFVIKEFFKQWRPSTAKSKHSIAIRLTLLIKYQNNKANITDYPLIHRLCTGNGIWWEKLYIDSFQLLFIDCHNNLSSLHFEITIELVQPFLKKCPIHPCFLLRSISARKVTGMLEAPWTGRFSSHKHRNLLTKGVRRSYLY